MKDDWVPKMRLISKRVRLFISLLIHRNLEVKFLNSEAQNASNAKWRLWYVLVVRTLLRKWATRRGKTINI